MLLSLARIKAISASVMITPMNIVPIAARIKAKGWPLDREPSETPWGDWAFALTDPDGFKITFIQE